MLFWELLAINLFSHFSIVMQHKSLLSSAMVLQSILEPGWRDLLPTMLVKLGSDVGWHPGLQLWLQLIQKVLNKAKVRASYPTPNLITSAEEFMFSPVSVCLLVVWFMCQFDFTKNTEWTSTKGMGIFHNFHQFLRESCMNFLKRKEKKSGICRWLISISEYRIWL